MQFNDEIFERNILALSTKNSELAGRVTHTAPLPNLISVPSKTGSPVPAIRGEGRDSCLHSRFNPQKEAQRIAEGQQGSGYLIVFGLGAGYHIQPFLHRQRISDILILDKDIHLFRSLLEQFDYRPIFLDPRVQIQVDLEPEDLHTYLLGHYHPAVMGNLNTVKLPSRIRLDASGFEAIANTIRRIVSNLADDYTVQATFGKKWFTNTLRNLPTAAQTAATLRPSRQIIVTGAGPSLEEQLPAVHRQQKQGSTLLATDTSLPVLLLHGMKPDIVISIDCQQVSYHHFLQGYPREIPLVLDLASPPEIARLSDRPFFFSSGHPFSLFISRRFRSFPEIDTSGGNVSHAAVSLANLMGAHRIFLYGTDFSYPQGKLYSRGTYIYPYFRTRESRLYPLESAMISFLFRNTNILKNASSTGFRYTTKPMISYKKRLEDAVSKLSSQVIPGAGEGEPLTLNQEPLPPNTEETDSRISPFITAGSPHSGWHEFLTSYLEDLKALPSPSQPLGRYFAGLTHKQKDLWTTLFPAAAHFRQAGEMPPAVGRESKKKIPREEDSAREKEGAEILNQALEWSLNTAKQILNGSIARNTDYDSR